MYKILTSGSGYLIQEEDNPDNVIKINDMVAMLRLRKRILDLVDTLVTDDEVDDHESAGQEKITSSVGARRIAADLGYDLPNNTLLYACQSGSIEGAEKIGGRWSVPTAAFLKWFELWKSKASHQ